MTGFETKLNKLDDEIQAKIDELIDAYGIESQFTSNICYDCRYDEDLQFNVNSTDYLVELHKDGILSNDGQKYNYDVLATRDLCFIVDTIIFEMK